LTINYTVIQSTLFITDFDKAMMEKAVYFFDELRTEN